MSNLEYLVSFQERFAAAGEPVTKEGVIAEVKALSLEGQVGRGQSGNLCELLDKWTDDFIKLWK